MRKPHPHPATPPPTAGAARRPWRLALVLLAAVSAGAVAYTVFSSDAAGPAPEGMVWAPPGSFLMGSDEFPDARPVHKVELSGFWVDATEVTNEQFAAFVAATGYRTVAERKPDLKDFPPWLSDEEKEKIRKAEPFSLVFVPPESCPDGETGSCDQWWRVVHGADWRHPEGPNSTIKAREKHPVVHIAREDAVAYAKWAGKRLPTEAEWEYAARAGGTGRFYWGDERTPGGRWMANIWQGKFPCGNTAEDGFAGTAPVGSYPPNAWGLHDMAGNVWEWCADYYQPGFAPPAYGAARDPKGPTFSIDTHGGNEEKRVLRGGSFLCSDTYCLRYRPGGRQQGEPKTGQSHTGFRCVLSPGGKK